MKRAILINQSSGYLVIDIANAYAELYDEVVLIMGSLNKNERQLDCRVKICRICEYNRNSTMKRMLSWVWGTIQIFFLLLFKYREGFVCYFTNPPMSYFNALILRRNYSIVEYDIYPQALKSIGIKEGNLICRFWEWVNRKTFKHANYIYTLSDGMKALLTKYTTEDKIKVVPNWSASDRFKVLAQEENPFVKVNNLNGKFVVLYSGNIGYTHNVEILIELAKRMRSVKNLQFVIIGEGKKKDFIKKEILDNQLLNCTILPYQEIKTLPFSLASANIGVITLDENVASVSVPSKTYNLLAVGAPLLCIVDKETEIHKLVTVHDNGRCFPKTDLEAMEKYIKQLMDHPEEAKRLSDNSIKASKLYSKENANLYVE